MDLQLTDSAGAPARWLLCFTGRSELWWINLIPGRFKHVRAFSYTSQTDCWMFYDPCLRTALFTARGEAARSLMLAWSRGAVVLAMAPLADRHLRLSPFSCVTAIASLMCLPGGALRPDGLYRQCLRHGAQIVDGTRSAANPADRPPA